MAGEFYKIFQKRHILQNTSGWQLLSSKSNLLYCLLDRNMHSQKQDSRQTEAAVHNSIIK